MNKIHCRLPEEFRFHCCSSEIQFHEVIEGYENDLFWSAFDEHDHQRSYYSLLDSTITDILKKHS